MYLHSQEKFHALLNLCLLDIQLDMNNILYYYQFVDNHRLDLELKLQMDQFVCILHR